MMPKTVNRELIEDLAQRLGTSDLLDWIESRTTEVARLGWKRPGYIDLGPRLLAEVGVAACVGDTQIADLATIRPQESGTYVIRHHHFQTRPFGSLEDHRFWIAHELSHTFWFRSEPSGRPLSPRQRVVGSDPTIEWLCNRAAAALLVPRGLLEALLREEGYALGDTPPPIHLIHRFARKLRVAPRLLARRWFHDILDSERNVFCISPSPQPSENELGTTRFRIVWEAIFARSTKLSRRLQGRIVRFKRTEISDSERTVQIDLDGRWLSLVEQARSAEQPSAAFSRLPGSPKISAEFARIGRSMLLSFLG